MSANFGFRFQYVAILLITALVAGCGGGEREEEFGTVEGTVKYGGNPVPKGAQLVLDDKTKGVRMTFEIGEGGKYTVSPASQLPAGNYAVAVTPPADEGVAEADYEAAMSNPDAAPKAPKKDDFPVPEQFRDPAQSGKTIDVKSGSQTIDIDF